MHPDIHTQGETQSETETERDTHVNNEAERQGEIQIHREAEASVAKTGLLTNLIQKYPCTNTVSSYLGTLDLVKLA